ncbi:PstS family phosphate ABC transporter substrate-binding protein [Rudaea sp.]|uniref:PstS family phosphate ABC transporter substrate-binding protein n=1 Tax=Rudaea sp. TaxID=2136325 RepID=UPI002ED50CA9
MTASKFMLLTAATAAFCFSATTRAAENVTVSSIGASEMAPLMDAWMQALHARRPEITRGVKWQHQSNDAAIGALMFDQADITPITRSFQKEEIAPYVHQFAGDMMKTPVTVRVALREAKPVFLAFNKRPDTPPVPAVSEFVRFALSAEGQKIVAQTAGFQPLPQNDIAQELPKIAGYVAKLDPALPVYTANTKVQGDVRSVGSDGMKSLMERWMRDFRALQPGVRKGDPWEHLGTLNGFGALMVGMTDLAPMGRELWPDEDAAFAHLHDGEKLFEIRVARGGFNTNQRTTAQAIFVNEKNPLKQITLAQLKAVFGKNPTITRWGQLGLSGEWANKTIVLDTPPLVAPNAMSMQFMVLHGGEWADGVHQGSIADTAKAIAADADALGFGGLEEGGPGPRAVPVARDANGPAIEINAETASSGRYPLTRYMYIRMRRAPGQPLPALIKEFLRYVLSRQGQEPILYSGYFPLNANEVKEELAKLE